MSLLALDPGSWILDACLAGMTPRTLPRASIIYLRFKKTCASHSHQDSHSPCGVFDHTKIPKDLTVVVVPRYVHTNRDPSVSSQLSSHITIT